MLTRTTLALLSVLLLGCAGANASDAPAGRIHDLNVTAADFHFRTPQRVPAGLTRIRMHNEGTQPHHVQLIRLAKGHTVSELVERLNARDFQLPWATFVGGPDTPGPSGVAEVTLELTAGEYAMICFITGSDRVPHFAKGMVIALSVTDSSLAPAPEPRPDVAMLLREYSFDLTPQLTSGRRTIRVENAGAQPHHVAIVRLGANRSVADALAWLEHPTGPDPDTPFGGTTALAPGTVNYVTADFSPGKYALICFVPDVKDGRSHIKHGMVKEISVQ